METIELKKTKKHSTIFRFDLTIEGERDIYHQIMQGHWNHHPIVVFTVKEVIIGNHHIAFVEALDRGSFDKYYGGS